MRKGDFVKVEFRDGDYRLLLRGKYNLNNKEEIRKLLSIIEKFSGMSIHHIVSMREWI